MKAPRPSHSVFLLCLLAFAAATAARAGRAEESAWPHEKLSWQATAPLLGPEEGRADVCRAIKDPSLVFFENRWHVFATIKCRTQTRMEQLSFAAWNEAHSAKRHVISLVEEYHCAPQVFYFRPHQKWYLIYQWTDKSRNYFGPGFSTLESPSRPETLTPPKMLYPEKPAPVKGWLDFWVICDDERAHLFFTSLDGRLWRAETKLDQFPGGWNAPQVALQADIFEASHTYRLQGKNEFLTIIEAQGPGGTRYFKAYLASKLAGPWRPLADSFEHPFAGRHNVTFAPGVEAWTDSISHGEIVRAGIDETMTIDPAHPEIVFQGCTAAERAGKEYGAYPWRIGILRLR